MVPHTHTTSVSIGSANNDPPYYTLSLIRIDASVWLSSVRSLPPNAVVASDRAISWNELSRFTPADNRLVKLGSPGSTGGSSTHNHSFSGTLAAYKSCNTPYGNTDEPETVDYADCMSHSHTISGSLSSADLTPSYVRTRLYQVTTQTIKVPARVVCFFDGTPPAPFSVITGWDNRILSSGDVNPTTGGADSHNHGSVGVYSTYYDLYTYDSYVYCGNEPWSSVPNHRHYVSFSVSSSDHTPPYVYLVPAYLTQDVWRYQTYEKSHAGGVALAQRKTKSSDIVMLLIREGYRTLNADLVARRIATRLYNMDVRILRGYDASYQSDIVLFKTLRRILAASMILNPTPLIRREYDAGIRIVNPQLMSPNVTVIDTLLKSYIYEFDKVLRQLQLMHLRHRLDLATGTDLDEEWGKVFQLPRYADEPDDVYRKRLQLHILMILACGTAPGCEEVLGELVDDPGSVRVESEWPATVRVHFDTDRAVRNADYYRGMLEYLRTRLFAAGVNVVYHITYADLVADIVLKGTVETEFRSDLLIEQPDLETSYSGGLVSVLGQAIDLDADLYLLRRPVRQLRALIAARKALEISFNGGLACKTIHEMSGEIGLVLLARARRDYSASVAHLKRGLMRTHVSGIALQRVYSVPLFGSIRLELRGGAQYSGGIRIVGGIP